MVVIDAGARPRPLAITGTGDVPVLDSTSIMELDELPEHLIIVGGGYIGLEFGQMFRRFGSEVTIIQRAVCLMMIEDEDVSDEVAAILRDDGITVLSSTTPVRVEPAEGLLCERADVTSISRSAYRFCAFGLRVTFRPPFPWRVPAGEGVSTRADPASCSTIDHLNSISSSTSSPSTSTSSSART